MKESRERNEESRERNEDLLFVSRFLAMMTSGFSSYDDRRVTCFEELHTLHCQNYLLA